MKLLGLDPHDLRVSLDIGCYRHAVAVGTSDGRVIDEFDMDHTKDGFDRFFARVEKHRTKLGGGVAVAMEGFGGHARPLDDLVRERNYRLFNVNNLKLARFKEIFPAPAKTDRIDAAKELELFTLCDVLESAKGTLQEVVSVPEENQMLKRLTRRREALVKDKVVLVHRIHSYLQAASPGLVEITTAIERVWFLNFLTSRKDLRTLGRMRCSSILKIPKVGKHFAAIIEQWQKQSCFSSEAPILGPMIIEDAKQVLALRRRIQSLEAQCEELSKYSAIAKRTATIPGFGSTGSSTLAGEIGTIERFEKEGSLAVYMGMAPLSKDSGESTGSRGTKHVNVRLKKLMMTCVERHREQVPQSNRFYARKCSEGKSHNQAIRALGRYLVRVIYRMLIEDRDYEIRK